MATRGEVYLAFDSERAYQDAGVEDIFQPNMQVLSAGEMILAMEHCLDKARIAWYHEAEPYPFTTEYLRKVGALVVQFMEQYGAPQREGFKR